MNNVIGDVRDLEHLQNVFTEVQPEIVFHFATRPIVRESCKETRYTYETNVMGTVNLLECVRQYWNLEKRQNEANELFKAKWKSKAEHNAPHEATFLKVDCSLLKKTFSWKPRCILEC